MISSKPGIIDPDLEKSDPTPSIYDLFRQFNQRFFWDSLNMVEVKWSGRQMTSCAGVCSFHPRTNHCQIRLSAPLLSLRPRKDLVETLLHEMIHAYLFVTKNRKDRSDHGPEFHKHMDRINDAAGTNISVYHTFRDEVRHLQGHVWRCDGPCQKTGPYYGIVRRATNRAPGPNDNWWERHRMVCSGVYQKIKEPPGYVKGGKKKENKKGKQPPKPPNLGNFFTPVAANVGKGITPSQPNGSYVKSPLVNSKVQTPNVISNIHTFGSTNGRVDGITTINGRSRSTFPSKPSATGEATGFTGKKPSSTYVPSARDQARNVWANKNIVPGSSTKDPLHSKRPSSSSDVDYGLFKKPKIDEQTRRFNKNVDKLDCPARDQVRNVWANKNVIVPGNSTKDSVPLKQPSASSDVDYELFKKPKIDEQTPRFDKGKLMADVLLECPVCEKFVAEKSLETHVNSCLDTSFGDDDPFKEPMPVPQTSQVPSSLNSNSHQVTRPCPVCSKPVGSGGLDQHLSECLNESITEDFFDDWEEDKKSKEGTASTSEVPCPVCSALYHHDAINRHIDECLTMEAIKSGTF